MAASIADILTFEQARPHVNVDDDVLPGSAEGIRLTEAIGSAVDYVSRYTGRPLLDHDETFDIERPCQNDPLILPTIHVKAITSISYWETDQELREAPTGTITVGDLGRRKELIRDTHVWPPAGGWPEVLRESMFEVVAMVGFDIDEQSRSLWQALILVTREFYESPERIENDFAMMALLNPWRRWSGVV